MKSSNMIRSKLTTAIRSASFYAGVGVIAATGMAASQVYAQSGLLEEVVVTAQKREQNLQEVPISVSVMSADSLEKQNINDMESLAVSVPSLTLQGGFAPSATSFNIRGVSSYTFTGGVQPSVSMVVDGVTYARAGEFNPELAYVDRIEILRGPQGTLFGRNSTAGVINVTTREASDYFTGEVGYSYTDEEEHLLKGYVSGPITDSVKYSLAGYTLDRDGHVDNINPQGVDAGAHESWGVRGKLDVQFSDDVRAVFIADYRDMDFSPVPQVVDIAEDGVVGQLRQLAHGNGDAALGRAVLADRFTININEEEEGDSELDNWGLSADVTWDIGENLTLRSITAYREWHEVVNNDFEGSSAQVANNGFGLATSLSFTNLDVVDDRMYNLKENEFVTQEFRLESFGDNVDWVAGVFYQDFEEKNDLNVNVYIPFLPAVSGPALSQTLSENSDELTAASVFGDVTIHVTDALDIYGGFRFSYEDIDLDINRSNYFAPGALGVFTLDAATNSAFTDTTHPAFASLFATTAGTASKDDSDWSGRLGFNWAVADSTNVYGQVSRGYVGQAVNISNRGTPDDSAFLNPTIAEAIEFGVKTEIGDRARLNAAVFYQETTDLQTQIFPPGTITSVAVNAGVLEVTGLEVDFQWAVTDYFQLSAAATYLDAELNDLLQPCFDGQVIATGCNLDSFGNITNDPMQAVQHDVSGNRPPNTPEFAYNITADFFAPLGDMPFEGYARFAYTWQDDVSYQLYGDPLLIQPDYGLLDITLGITDKEGRYDIALFAKNATDEEYINDAIAVTGFVGRRIVRLSRGARSYFGINLNYKFGGSP